MEDFSAFPSLSKSVLQVINLKKEKKKDKDLQEKSPWLLCSFPNVEGGLEMTQPLDHETINTKVYVTDHEEK